MCNFSLTHIVTSTFTLPDKIDVSFTCLMRWPATSSTHLLHTLTHGVFQSPSRLPGPLQVPTNITNCWEIILILPNRPESQPIRIIFV
jgi:hypothetical protein